MSRLDDDEIARSLREMRNGHSSLLTSHRLSGYQLVPEPAGTAAVPAH
jgi:ABC-type transport system involved in Fe-S cluster assembly fused permease/ATPase subunit